MGMTIIRLRNGFARSYDLSSRESCLRHLEDLYAERRRGNAQLELDVNQGFPDDVQGFPDVQTLDEYDRLEPMLGGDTGGPR